MSAPLFRNLARLDLVSLRLMILCADEGSLTAAARRANLSKSNASQRLASLEASIGAPVLERTTRGVRVTATGAVVVNHGRAILRQVEELNRELALRCHLASA